MENMTRVNLNSEYRRKELCYILGEAKSLSQIIANASTDNIYIRMVKGLSDDIYKGLFDLLRGDFEQNDSGGQERDLRGR